MDPKIFDFSSLFQVALGMNLAVPFLGDAMNRPLSRLRRTLDSLPALQNLMPDAERGEYLGEIWTLEEKFRICEGDIKKFADALSLALLVFSVISFAVLYFGAHHPQAELKAWVIDALLAICFVPPMGGVITLFLYSENCCTDVQINMKKVYESYIEKRPQQGSAAG